MTETRVELGTSEPHGDDRYSGCLWLVLAPPKQLQEDQGNQTPAQHGTWGSSPIKRAEERPWSNSELPDCWVFKHQLLTSVVLSDDQNLDLGNPKSSKPGRKHREKCGLWGNAEHRRTHQWINQHRPLKSPRFLYSRLFALSYLS